MQAVAESGRASEIAIYNGSDDNFINDLLTVYDFNGTPLRMFGGQLEQLDRFLNAYPQLQD